MMTDKELQDFIDHGVNGFREFSLLFGGTWASQAVMIAKEYQARLAQPEPVMWQNAALRLGEDLSTVGPDGYYNMTAKQWLDWALSVITKIQIDYMQLGACEEKSRKDYIGLILGVRVDDASVIIKTKNKDNAKYLCNELLNEKEIYYYPAPPKKEWVGLTDEERYCNDGRSEQEIEYAKAIEAKLKEKNNGNG